MQSDDLSTKQRDWAERGLLTARKMLPLMAPVGQYAGWSSEERKTISYLCTATARATESALLLCAYGQLWDAEVILRSALEGSLKFAYLLQSHETFADRHREYANDLFEIALVKDHRKASDLLSTLRDPDGDEWRPIRERMLTDEEIAQIGDRLNRRKRAALESRWGFTGLIGELARSADPLFRDVPALAHGYSMASHIHHVDMVGASLPLDRDLRSEDRRTTLHLAHIGRLVSDALTFLHLRLRVGYRFVGADVTPLAEANTLVDAARRWQEEAYRRWLDVEYDRSKPC